MVLIQGLHFALSLNARLSLIFYYFTTDYQDHPGNYPVDLRCYQLDD